MASIVTTARTRTVKQEEVSDAKSSLGGFLDVVGSPSGPNMLERSMVIMVVVMMRMRIRMMTKLKVLLAPPEDPSCCSQVGFPAPGTSSRP